MRILASGRFNRSGYVCPNSTKIELRPSCVLCDLNKQLLQEQFQLNQSVLSEENIVIRISYPRNGNYSSLRNFPMIWNLHS